jgi:hypothetical protein
MDLSEKTRAEMARDKARKSFRPPCRPWPVRWRNSPSGCSREHIGEHAAGVMMAGRFAAGSVVDYDYGQFLPGTFGSFSERTGVTLWPSTGAGSATTAVAAAQRASSLSCRPPRLRHHRHRFHRMHRAEADGEPVPAAKSDWHRTFSLHQQPLTALSRALLTFSQGIATFLQPLRILGGINDHQSRSPSV